MRWLERHHIRHRELLQPLLQAAILCVEVISYHCPERPPLLDGLLNELQGDLELGTKGRIVSAFGKGALGSVGLEVNRIVDALIGPQARHRNHPIVDFAHIAQILTSYMCCLVTILAISRLIDHQHSVRVGSRDLILPQQPEPLGLDLALIPVRL